MASYTNAGLHTTPGLQTPVLGFTLDLASGLPGAHGGLAPSFSWEHFPRLLTLNQATMLGSALPTAELPLSMPAVFHMGSLPISQPDCPVSFDKGEMKRGTWEMFLQ